MLNFFLIWLIFCFIGFQLFLALLICYVLFEKSFPDDDDEDDDFEINIEMFNKLLKNKSNVPANHYNSQCRLPKLSVIGHDEQLKSKLYFY